jgi:hypothetical protein
MKALVSVLALTALVAFASGCSSAAPGAEKIRVTNNPKDVAGCKVAGQVSGLTGGQAYPDSKTKMRNAALALGADTIYVTSTVNLTGGYEGMSYNCGGADTRLPMPVVAVPAATPAPVTTPTPPAGK